MPRLVMFRGFPDPWHRKDQTGYNQTGYVTDDNIVIHTRRSRIVRTHLREIEHHRHLVLDISGHSSARQIEAFFTSNVINNVLYTAAIREIASETSGFWNCPVKIPYLSLISEDERNSRWNTVLQVLQPGDGIFTFDTKSTLSRIITYLDQGTWSHAATYVGNGNVVEAIGEGVLERSIKSYQTPPL